MKKLLTVLAASVGIAAFADTDPLSATSFETYAAGVDFSVTNDDFGVVLEEANIGDKTWAGSADADGDTNEIKAYGDTQRPSNRPDYYKNATPNDYFLKIDSTGGLSRYVKKGDANGVTLDTANVYFDMDVQFTVSDSVQQPDTLSGDKLLVWLYGEDGDAGDTNLVITAATIDNELEPHVVHYVVTTPEILPETWYRLTVETTTLKINKTEVPHFKVYINGVAVAPDKVGVVSGDKFSSLDDCDAPEYFGSCVKVTESDATTTSLKTVTFKGTGALDDIVIYSVEKEIVKPFQVEQDPYDTFADAVEAGSTITMCANYDVVNEEDGGIEIEKDVTLNLGTFTLSSTVNDNNTISVSDGTLTLLGTGSVTANGGNYCAYVEGTLVIGNADGVPTIASVALGTSGTVKYYGTTGTRPAVYDDNSDAITGTWEAEAGETGYYVFTAGGDEPSSDTYDIPGDASLSADGTITVPTGTAKIKLGEDDVTAGFTIEGTTATLKTPVIEATADTTDEDTKDEALVVTDKAVKIGVKAVKGLCYGVGSNTDVKAITRPASLIKFTGNNRAVIFTKAKDPNADGEFYKVYVDIKE